jgi:hypothetical protein
MAAIASLRYFLLIRFSAPLFDDLTIKAIRNPFFPGKALEPPGFEDAHSTP